MNGGRGHWIGVDILSLTFGLLLTIIPSMVYNLFHGCRKDAYTEIEKVSLNFHPS